MDLLDFFENVCEYSTPGNAVDTREISKVGPWVHAQALSKRLGFTEDPAQPGVYLDCRKEQTWTLRWVRKNEFLLWHELFRVCFGHDISEEQWRWKYRDTDKPGIAVLVQGQMVAFYGGMPRTLRALGQDRLGIQIGDVMVHPGYRGSLSRKGPFQMVASTFLEQNLSKGAPYWVGFGFPNSRAMQVAERLGLYRQVDEVVELAWDANPTLLPWWLSTTSVNATAALRHVDRLWAAMQVGFGSSILGVRDKHFVQTRYAAHPLRQHIWLLLRHRFSRQVLGLAVCKLESDGRVEILDLLGKPEFFSHMVAAVQQHSVHHQRTGIFMWLTKSHQHWLSATCPRVLPLNVSVPSNVWVEGNVDIPVIDRWWLTGGDTDFR